MTSNSDDENTVSNTDVEALRNKVSDLCELLFGLQNISRSSTRSRSRAKTSTTMVQIRSALKDAYMKEVARLFRPLTGKHPATPSEAMSHGWQVYPHYRISGEPSNAYEFAFYVFETLAVYREHVSQWLSQSEPSSPELVFILGDRRTHLSDLADSVSMLKRDLTSICIAPHRRFEKAPSHTRPRIPIHVHNDTMISVDGKHFRCSETDMQILRMLFKSAQHKVVTNKDIAATISPELKGKARANETVRILQTLRRLKHRAARDGIPWFLESHRGPLGGHTLSPSFIVTPADSE